MAQRGDAADRPTPPERDDSSATDEALEHRGSGVGEHGAEGPSAVDAMGEDKRRQVVGHSYGPTARSQVVFFAIVGAIAVAIIGGWTLAVAAFDQPPDEYPDEAPWSASDAPQVPTRAPTGPCGEPGNAYPPAADSPCATGTLSTDEAPLRGTSASRQEEGPGGAIGGGSESEAGASGGSDSNPR
jgi:hypothetical protein